MALQVVQTLGNGHGGIDWAGLPLVVEWLGITDVDGLLHRVTVIKSYRKPGAEPD